MGAGQHARLLIKTQQVSGSAYMKLLVFQHIDCEHPGIFRQFFDETRIEWHAVKLDSGEQIPPLERFDALWVMGGPMDVWDTDSCPWLVPEKEAIRRWVQTLINLFLVFVSVINFLRIHLVEHASVQIDLKLESLMLN